jgi:hypothetical protein
VLEAVAAATALYELALEGGGVEAHGLAEEGREVLERDVLDVQRAK